MSVPTAAHPRSPPMIVTTRGEEKDSHRWLPQAVACLLTVHKSASRTRSPFVDRITFVSGLKTTRKEVPPTAAVLENLPRIASVETL